MKKYTSLLSLFALAQTLSAFSIVGGGTPETNLKAGLAGSYNETFNITAGENGFAGSSDTGLITITKTNDNFWANASSNIVADANFTFAGPVKLETTSNYTGIYIRNGASLKFTNGFTSSTTKAGQQRITITSTFSNTTTGTGTMTRGYVEITSKTGSLYDSASLSTDSQLILGATDLTLKAATGVNEVNIGYFQLFLDSNLILETNVKCSQLAPRTPLDLVSRKAGTIKLQGHKFHITNAIWFNPDQNYTSDLYVDMAGDSTSTFVVDKGLSFNGNRGTKDDFTVYFTNVGLEDKILFDAKLNDNSLSMLNINGKEGSDILMKEVQFDSKTYYQYYVIPEPATYAGILGALAIAFAFMRRRK